VAAFAFSLLPTPHCTARQTIGQSCGFKKGEEPAVPCGPGKIEDGLCIERDTLILKYVMNFSRTTY
jgi:hypothetical protein